MKELAGELALEPTELAEGILDVANTNMERAIRVISVERGHDPREFALFSFGGAGGMHAAHLAGLLNMSEVFVPVNPGILSALGMLMADVIKDYSRTVMLAADEVSADDLEEFFASIEERGSEELAEEGIREDRITLERYLDMRYEGQSFEIIVPFGDDPVEAFHAAHEKTYGYRNEKKPVQTVNVRLRARGAPAKPTMPESALAGEKPDQAARLATNDVVFDGRSLPTAVYDRGKLRPGNVFEGPAVVVEYTSTILVPPFAKARIDGYANMIVNVEK
jgi:N-methylhydantoinase A